MALAFINYRVDEQPAAATLLDRALSERLGTDAVFLAARSIRAGDDFRAVVFDQLRRSAVVLAVIGPRWTEWIDAAGPPAHEDWVQRELAEAFARKIRVIPILLEETPLPAVTRLPPDLQALASCQYLRLHHYNAESDLARIADEVERILNPRPRPLAPRLPSAPGPHQEADETVVRHFRLSDAPPTHTRLAVLPGSILRVRGVGAWVNSENTEMEMARTSDFSLSGIIRYWGSRRDAAGRMTDDLVGDELRRSVAGQTPVAPGTAVVTGAGALAASHGVQYIVHVAAVRGEPGAGFRQIRDVSLCVANALAAAERLAVADHRVRSVVVPLLGAGSGGGALDPTARGVLRAAVQHLRSSPSGRLETIYLLAFTHDELAALLSAIDRSAELRPDDSVGIARWPGEKATGNPVPPGANLGTLGASDPGPVGRSVGGADGRQG